LVVVVKGTFTIPAAGGEPETAPVQAPLVEADVFTGEPGKSAALYESDFAPRKPKCDVLLNGSAHAPGGVPAVRVQAMLQVGSMRKVLEVVGDRAWVKGLMMFTATRPIPFKSKRISYDTAFGGIDATLDPPQFYPLNFAGRGFYANLSAEAITGKLLPNTQEAGVEVTSPKGGYRPMAFGAIGRAWRTRAPLGGTYDQKWLDNVAPFLPADFKDEYYQSAPPDQQIPYPKGGEEVTLLNLTPDGQRRFRLPTLQVPVTFFPRTGEPVETAPVIDTILVEPDLARFSMTWRTLLPLKKDVFEIRQIVVGRMSNAWYTARRLGKVYCDSLESAIRNPGLRTRGVATT
ncbi:MAG TPA: DUF2169 domain-containing protein, partial [Planctomycetota bacterium]|nr:DUF2169 domain-containing protein [Planctomycetota bacterium]